MLSLRTDSGEEWRVGDGYGEDRIIWGKGRHTASEEIELGEGNGRKVLACSMVENKRFRL